MTSADVQKAYPLDYESQKQRTSKTFSKSSVFVFVITTSRYRTASAMTRETCLCPIIPYLVNIPLLRQLGYRYVAWVDFQSRLVDRC